DHVICLGDAVGRNGSDQTLALLQERKVPCVNGNHEVDIMPRYQVSDEWRAWVETWPDFRVDNDLLYTHTLVDQSRRFLEIDSIFTARSMFESGAFRVAFVGHSHSPGWWTLQDGNRPFWRHA